MEKTGKAVSSSETGRPIMVLLEVLGQRWALRILWELQGEKRLTFRQLQECCDQISPTVLNRRLKELREARLINHDGAGFGYTEQGKELARHLLELNTYAKRWVETHD